MIRSFFFSALVWLCATTALYAAPEPYKLDVARSQVGFSYDFQGAEKTGVMPISAARMVLDLDNVSASRVDVTLDASKARAGFIFATQTMKSPDVLDTQNHPTIQFRSTRISGSRSSAVVEGNLTVRGVTRPVTLQAGLFRQRGTDPSSRDHLVVLLTGEINRAEFGADGFAGFVGTQIRLRIIARIDR